MEICKLCLKQTCIYYALQEPKTATMLQSIVPIHHLSKIPTNKICSSCLLNLKLAYKFQQQVFKACCVLNDKILVEIKAPPQLFSECVNIDVDGNVKPEMDHFELNSLGIQRNETCRICGSVVEEHLFSNHISEHFEMSQECSICEKVFRNATFLRNHLQEHREKQRFECLNCGFTFQYRSIYDLHIKTVCVMRTSNDTDEQLPPVKKKAPPSKSYYNRKSQIRPKLPTKLNLADGNKGAETENRSILNQDNTNEIDSYWDMEEPDIEMEIHDNATNLNIFGESIDLELETEDEIALRDKNRAPEYQTPEYEENDPIDFTINTSFVHPSCEKCNALLSNLEVFKKHTNSTTTCPVCEEVVQTCCFRKHSLTHPITFEKRLCYVCGLQVCNINEHIKQRHTEFAKYVCHCSKQFRSTDRLNRHKRREHGGTRDVVCDQCGKSFFNRANLKRHIEFKHLKLREHICFYCKKAFSSKYALRTHVRIHTNELPYTCDICGEGYAAKISLTNHLKSKHNIVNKITCHCKECGKGFATPLSLYAHTRIHL